MANYADFDGTEDLNDYLTSNASRHYRDDDDFDTEDGEHRAMREEAEREAAIETAMWEDGRMRAVAGTPYTLRDPQTVGRFLLAGNAIFTLRSRKTGSRFTYRVSHKKGGDVSFVSLLTGSDNSRDYSYMGLLPDDKPTSLRGVGKGKSCASYDAPSAKAFQYLLDSIIKGQIPESLEVWHEGRCGRCGRRLTVPESIDTGLGPECADKV